MRSTLPSWQGVERKAQPPFVTPTSDLLRDLLTCIEPSRSSCIRALTSLLRMSRPYGLEVLRQSAKTSSLRCWIEDHLPPAPFMTGEQSADDLVNHLIAVRLLAAVWSLSPEAFHVFETLPPSSAHAQREVVKACELLDRLPSMQTDGPGKTIVIHLGDTATPWSDSFPVKSSLLNFLSETIHLVNTVCEAMPSFSSVHHMEYSSAAWEKFAVLKQRFRDKLPAGTLFAIATSLWKVELPDAPREVEKSFTALRLLYLDDSDSDPFQLEAMPSGCMPSDFDTAASGVLALLQALARSRSLRVHGQHLRYRYWRALRSFLEWTAAMVRGCARSCERANSDSDVKVQAPGPQAKFLLEASRLVPVVVDLLSGQGGAVVDGQEKCIEAGFCVMDAIIMALIHVKALTQLESLLTGAHPESRRAQDASASVVYTDKFSNQGTPPKVETQLRDMDWRALTHCSHLQVIGEGPEPTPSSGTRDALEQCGRVDRLFARCALRYLRHGTFRVGSASGHAALSVLKSVFGQRQRLIDTLSPDAVCKRYLHDVVVHFTTVVDHAPSSRGSDWYQSEAAVVAQRALTQIDVAMRSPWRAHTRLTAHVAELLYYLVHLCASLAKLELTMARQPYHDTSLSHVNAVHRGVVGAIKKIVGFYNKSGEWLESHAAQAVVDHVVAPDLVRHAVVQLLDLTYPSDTVCLKSTWRSLVPLLTLANSVLFPSRAIVDPSFRTGSPTSPRALTSHPGDDKHGSWIEVIQGCRACSSRLAESNLIRVTSTAAAVRQLSVEGLGNARAGSGALPVVAPVETSNSVIDAFLRRMHGDYACIGRWTRYQLTAQVKARLLPPEEPCPGEECAAWSVLVARMWEEIDVSLLRWSVPDWDRAMFLLRVLREMLECHFDAGTLNVCIKRHGRVVPRYPLSALPDSCVEWPSVADALSPAAERKMADTQSALDTHRAVPIVFDLLHRACSNTGLRCPVAYLPTMQLLVALLYGGNVGVQRDVVHRLQSPESSAVFSSIVRHVEMATSWRQKGGWATQRSAMEKKSLHSKARAELRLLQLACELHDRDHQVS